MPACELIVVPYVLGHEGTGMGAGPLALLDGATEALRPERVTRIALGEPFTHEVGACFDLNRQVAAAVADTVSRGALPVVMTGNCNTQVGVASGAGADGLGLVWLDAHADFNTMDTTASGFFDGTALSMVVGDAAQALCATVPGYAPVRERDVLLVGVRDVDPGERTRLDASEVGEIATAHIAPVLPETPRISLHLDLDVLDPSHGRANAFAVPGGLDPAGLLEAVRAITAERELAAVTLSAYDPECDPAGGVRDAAVAALAAIG